MALITILEAAQISGKSMQTIRRMIKHKKIEVKKQKTPQGFNYLIVKESLASIANEKPIDEFAEDTVVQEMPRDHRSLEVSVEELFKKQFQPELERFTSTIQKLIEQNQHDKSNFFQLIKTFQDRVITLESHIKMLEAPKSQWWQFWK